MNDAGEALCVFSGFLEDVSPTEKELPLKFGIALFSVGFFRVWVKKHVDVCTLMKYILSSGGRLNPGPQRTQ